MILRHSQIKNHNFKWRFSVILPFKGYGPNLNQSPLPKSAIIRPDVLWSECFLFSISCPRQPPGDLWSLPATLTCNQWTHLSASFSMALFKLMHYILLLYLNPLAKPWSSPASLPLPFPWNACLLVSCLKAFFPASIMFLQAPNHKGPSII